MKKKIALLLTLALALSLAGCGGNNGQPSGGGNNPPGGSTAPPKSSTSSPSSPARSSEKPGEEFAGVTLEEGREFGSFYWAFSNAEWGFNQLILDIDSSIPDAYDSWSFTAAYDGISRCNGLLSALSEFDGIPEGETRSLYPYYDYEGTKQRSGDIVTAFIDDTLKEDHYPGKAGDHRYLEAVLDLKNLTLSYENTLKRDGDYVQRFAFEAVLLPDGTVLFQFFYLGYEPYGGGSGLGGAGKSFAVFKRISGGSYSAVIADIETDFGLTYDSIIGKGDMTTEEMARGYYVSTVFTVENGEFSFRGDVTGQQIGAHGLDDSYVYIIENGELRYEKK